MHATRHRPLQPLLTAARCRWHGAVLVLACLSAIGTPFPVLAVESEASEAAVQAAYLFNFARFTEWPPGGFSTRNAPLNYCLLGRRDALANAMNSLSDKPVQGHPLRFIQPERIEDIKVCHLVFMAETDPKRRAQALQILAAQPTLTVSDLDGFAKDGGMIGLIRVGTRLRFEINRSQTQRTGLRLSADLLNLATAIVEPEMGASR
ncbi:MAG: YfiR family protein [Rubrivivax sp.]|nr:MAG: YfiR family protein [Rubrivivax sp.]